MSPKQQERRFDPGYARTLLAIAEGEMEKAPLYMSARISPTQAN